MIRDIVKYNDREYRVTTIYFPATNIHTTEVRLIENGSVTDEVVYHFVTVESSESQDKHKDILDNLEKYLSEAAIRKYLIDRRGGPMTNFRKLQSMSIDELAEWLDENGVVDNSPWVLHFNNKYCANCESVVCKYEDAERVVGFKPFYDDEVECAYCEVYGKCRYFEDRDEVPDGVEMVKLWLNSEVE